MQAPPRGQIQHPGRHRSDRIQQPRGLRLHPAAVSPALSPLAGRSRQRWVKAQDKGQSPGESQVKRLVYEYPRRMTSATGDNLKAKSFNCEAASTKTAHEITVKTTAKRRLSLPVINGRIRVRGFLASNFRSAMRLKVMAALRAATIATMIQSNCLQVGHPRTARRAPVRANGNAKTECSNLIISSVVRNLARAPRVCGSPAGVGREFQISRFSLISEDYLA